MIRMDIKGAENAEKNSADVNEPNFHTLTPVYDSIITHNTFQVDEDNTSTSRLKIGMSAYCHNEHTTPKKSLVGAKSTYPSTRMPPVNINAPRFILPLGPPQGLLPLPNYSDDNDKKLPATFSPSPNLAHSSITRDNATSDKPINMPPSQKNIQCHSPISSILPPCTSYAKAQKKRPSNKCIASLNKKQCLLDEYVKGIAKPSSHEGSHEKSPKSSKETHLGESSLDVVRDKSLNIAQSDANTPGNEKPLEYDQLEHIMPNIGPTSIYMDNKEDDIAFDHLLQQLSKIDPK